MVEYVTILMFSSLKNLKMELGNSRMEPENTEWKTGIKGGD